MLLCHQSAEFSLRSGVATATLSEPSDTGAALRCGGTKHPGSSGRAPQLGDHWLSLETVSVYLPLCVVKSAGFTGCNVTAGFAAASGSSDQRCPFSQSRHADIFPVVCRFGGVAAAKEIVFASKSGSLIKAAPMTFP